MPDGYVVVLDAGTTRPRCVLFSRDGTVAAERAAKWVYVPPEDGSTLAKEFDLGRMWSDFSDMIAACLQDAGAVSSQVAAAAVTSQRQSVVFMDAEGRELYAGPNSDLRAVFAGAAMDEEMGDRIYRTTGHTPSMLLAPAKLRWMRDNRPEAYGRITTVFTLADWLVWKLTGVAANELTLAGESGLLDIAGRGWCSALLSDLDLGYIPKQRLVRPGTIVGTVVGGEYGPPEGIPVVAAGADTQCGLLGMGVTEPEQVGVVAGWSVPVQMVTAEPTFSADVKPESTEGHRWTA